MSIKANARLAIITARWQGAGEDQPSGEEGRQPQQAKGLARPFAHIFAPLTGPIGSLAYVENKSARRTVARPSD